MKLNSTMLVVADIDRSVEFYKKVGCGYIVEL